jgi:acetoacetate decarboxylase
MMLPDSYATSLPSAAPYYPRPPFLYRDCPVVVVTARSTPPALRRLVPDPLVPNPDDLVVLVIGRLHNDRLGAYGEAILGVPCALGTRTGTFAVALYLDRPSCIVGGREIWGWPKKDATLRLDMSRGIASAGATRDGVEIIRAEVETTGPAGPTDLRLDPTWFNLKLIPSVTDGGPPDVMQLTETTFGNVGVREARTGVACLGFADTVADPLASLIPVCEVVGGVVLRLDFDLLDGVVVHDYRTTQAASDRAAEATGIPA